MRFRLLFIIGIMLCALTGCNSNNPGPVQGLKDTIDDMLYDYESEKVFRNNDFSNILEGKKFLLKYNMVWEENSDINNGQQKIPR